MALTMSASLLELTFLAGLLMIIWPMFEKKAMRIRLLPWLPVLTITILLCTEYRDAFIMASDNPRVAMYLPEGASLLERIGMPSSNWPGAIAHLLLGMGIHFAFITETKAGLALLTFGQPEEKEERLRRILTMIAGAVWCVCLIGLIPDGSFDSGSGPDSPTQHLIVSVDVILTIAALLVFGWGLAGMIILSLRHSLRENAATPSKDTWGLMHPMAGLLVWIPVASLVFLSTVTKFSLDEDPQFANQLHFLITFSALAVASGSILHSSQLFEERLGSGKGRGKALSFGIGSGIIWMFISTALLLTNVDRIGDGAGLFIMTTWIIAGICAFGLLGLLLPLIGLDARARPEAWGWRIGLILAVPLLSIYSELMIYALPGVWGALLLSMVSPWIIEEDSPIKNKTSLTYNIGLHVVLLSLCLFTSHVIWFAISLTWIPVILFRRSLKNQLKLAKKSQNPA
jgi:hypothetical protein